jgi:hypothetical protein
VEVRFNVKSFTADRNHSFVFELRWILPTGSDYENLGVYMRYGRAQEEDIARLELYNNTPYDEKCEIRKMYTARSQETHNVISETLDRRFNPVSGALGLCCP